MNIILKIIISLCLVTTAFSQFPRNQHIVAAEYFINIDPGEDNGTPITANYGFWEVTVQVNDIYLPIGSTIYFRAKSSNGKWSAPRAITRKDFFTNHGATLQYGEYYINTDPGRGNGTPIDFSNGTAEFTPSDLRRGDKIFTRVKDSFNRWSQSREVTFNYIDMHNAEYRIKRSGGYLNSENMILSSLNDTSFFFYAYEYDIPLQLNDSIEVRYQRADGFYSKWGTEFSIASQTTYELTVDIANGWNMVSVPGINSDGQGISNWWINHTGTVYKFIPGSGYSGITTTTPGEGYWMKNVGTETYNTGDEWPAGGIQSVPHDPINAASGWNMFGGYDDVVDATALTTTPPGQIVNPIYKFLPGTGYQAATQIVPGYGYWVKVSSTCQINIPDIFAKVNQKVAEYIKDDWGRIIITDYAEKSYTLYAVKGKVNLDNYELPPMPPAGIFDIRFGSGRIAEDLSSSIQSILMAGIEHPVRVKVENMNITLQDESGKVINKELKPGEEITIDDNSINKLLVLSGELIAPVDYALEQNYPNPFNPTTTIEYALPHSENVSIKIFDILGSEVSVLVNEFQQVGNYSVVFDASKFASGIYFYRMQAGSFVKIMKMVVVK